MKRWRRGRRPRAFSSEVGPGWRKENTSKHKAKAASAERGTELAGAFSLFPRLRQVFALGQEFRRPLYKPADAAFAFGCWKRWIEQ